MTTTPDPTDWEQYRGDGREPPSLPPDYQPPPGYNHPKDYRAGDELRDAVNVALALGQPLLLTGVPGTGKSQLAWSLAWELGQGDPLVFHTKSTSEAGDLFYRFDALRRFHDAQARPGETAKALDPADYITYEPLGLAILRAIDPGDPRLPEPLRRPTPTRLVVLVDEVDKAPRDFPNDILNEIEHMTFQVKESRESFQADRSRRPILVMTSNSEKDLPDAFLRRCVYYHIPRPEGARLLEILGSRIPKLEDWHQSAVDHVATLQRDIKLNKEPGTAELIDWIRALAGRRVPPEALADPRRHWEALRPTYGVLLKKEDDLEAVRAKYGSAGG